MRKKWQTLFPPFMPRSCMLYFYVVCSLGPSPPLGGRETMYKLSPLQYVYVDVKSVLRMRS